MQTAKQVEAEVEQNRVALERTLSDLRHNLKPANLAQEALSGGLWFRRFQAFARTSPVSWAIMATAVLGVGLQASKRLRR